jgi:hypothetical protein
MAYNPELLVAPKGQARLVMYERMFDAEFLKVCGDYPSRKEADREILRRESAQPDPDAKRREYRVYGIFDARGAALQVQFPSNWPGNRWNNNWAHPIPNIFQPSTDTKPLPY